MYSTVVNFLGAISILLLLFKRSLLRIILRTLPRDCKGIWRLLQVAIQLRLAQRRNSTVGSLFNRTVKKYPHKVCFYFQDEQWTFKQLQEFGNKIGNYFSSLGYQKGDVVGIFMENCPEYVATWIGLSKIGVVPALINSNLRMQPLKHSVDVVNCKALIYSEELSDAVQDLVKLGGLAKVPIFTYKNKDCADEAITIKSATDLGQCLENCSAAEPIPSETVNFSDNLFYVYTSGTTGLPKAAVIKHSRFFMAGKGGHYMNVITSKDIMYNPLPLYHTGGGMLGVSQPILFGTGMVLRKKFSASQFWSDCVKFEVTVIQYIGECCRYLLAQPERPEETSHKVRLMLGNGLRNEIWPEFVQRFKIRQVAELYGSTEGNCNMVNIDNKQGAVGFLPRLVYPFLPMKIVRVDEKTGDIVRDPNTGLAILCSFMEPGELVAEIVKNHPIRDFEGYADPSAKRGKVAHDVLKKGDSCFRTGDILMMDDHGYIYFRDRSGDTFRWKGENVSTAEVEGVISNICDLKDCVVYGVEVPGTEGRCGMVTLQNRGATLDLQYFTQALAKNLPPYARPVFLRITKNNIDMTGTYKMKKTDLQREGFDPCKIQDDELYVFQGSGYTPLTSQLYADIQNQKIRL